MQLPLTPQDWILFKDLLKWEIFLNLSLAIQGISSFVNKFLIAGFKSDKFVLYSVKLIWDCFFNLKLFLPKTDTKLFSSAI